MIVAKGPVEEGTAMGVASRCGQQRGSSYRDLEIVNSRRPFPSEGSVKRQHEQ